MEQRNIHRRAMLAAGVALATAPIFACTQAKETRANAQDVQTSEGVTPARSLKVYRDPNCGCCANWIKLVQEAGYVVDIRIETDMDSIKRRLQVPVDLQSCHTAVLDGLVIEGHVPLKEVERIARERPKGVIGIAVPGMPAGSPGMEMPDGRKQAYDVIAFGPSTQRSYATYNQNQAL